MLDSAILKSSPSSIKILENSKIYKKSFGSRRLT